MPGPLESVGYGRVAHKARYDLPKEMSAGIGRVITRWSYAEENVQNLLYEMLYVSDAVGRIAIREPRITDRLDMIIDLLAAEEIKLSPELMAEFKSIYEQARQLSFFRDLFAHGAWYYSKQHKSWCVTNTRGQWDSEAKKYGVSGKKRIFPEGRLIDPSVLRDICDELEELIEKIMGLHVIIGIASHQALLDRQQQQSDR